MNTGAARNPSRYRATVTLRRPATVCGVAVWLAVRPIVGLWLDDAFYFLTGETTRKAKNLQANPQCVLTASSLALPALDVIIEGKASKVTDHTKVQQVVDAYTARLHWPLTVRDGGVFGPNAPTAGPPPYAVFELTPTTVVGLPGIAGTEAGEGAAGSFIPTRWRFQAATDASAAPTS